MSTPILRVAIIGASGYVGGELLRLALQHPSIQLSVATSETYKGKPFSAAFPGAFNTTGVFSELNLSAVINSSDVIFFAQDHGVAARLAGECVGAGRKVIDLSADFRLHNAATFQEWYKLEHPAPQLLPEAVYGLPELYREQITTAQLVANPGCYPTATALALLPLIKGHIIDPHSLIIDAKSGVSGAGRGKLSLDLHFAELNENFRAYGVGGKHRHTPEIEQTLTAVAGSPVVVSFTPHLLPITRGILATCYASCLQSDVDEEKVTKLATAFYASHPFVRVLPHRELPSTKAVYGTNQCHVSYAFDRRTNRVTALAVIDNLMKGAAGQAIQNFNLMHGLPETAGLSGGGIWP